MCFLTSKDFLFLGIVSLIHIIIWLIFGYLGIPFLVHFNCMKIPIQLLFRTSVAILCYSFWLLFSALSGNNYFVKLWYVLMLCAAAQCCLLPDSSLFSMAQREACTRLFWKPVTIRLRWNSLRLAEWQMCSRKRYLVVHGWQSVLWFNLPFHYHEV